MNSEQEARLFGQVSHDTETRKSSCGRPASQGQQNPFGGSDNHNFHGCAFCCRIGRLNRLFRLNTAPT